MHFSFEKGMRKQVLFAFILLFSIPFLLGLPPNQNIYAAESSWEWILETRGKDFEIYVNSSDVTIKIFTIKES